MEFKDYYQILEAAPDADEKQIKQTYRKLARQYHPDVNPGNKEAEQKFKEINEAYEVLSDPEQRKKYDELRADYQRYRQTGGHPQDYSWDTWAAQPGEGARVHYGDAADLEDLFGATSPYSDFFTQTFGETQEDTREPRRGRDLESKLQVTLEEAFHGGTRTLQVGERRIEAQIPPGVNTGSRIRLAGQGEPGRNGGPPGDLYLIVHVPPHSLFEREGDDLDVEVAVDIYTAALGGEVRVPTLDSVFIVVADSEPRQNLPGA